MLSVRFYSRMGKNGGRCLYFCEHRAVVPISNRKWHPEPVFDICNIRNNVSINRLFSTVNNYKSTVQQQDPNSVVIPFDDQGRAKIYEGNLSSGLKRIKRLSLITSCLGLVMLPKIIASGEETSVIAIVGFSIMTSIFTFVTPILIQQLSKRYVTEILYKPETDTYTFVTYNFFSLRKEVDCKADAIIAPEVPLGPFTSMLMRQNVNGKTKDLPLFIVPPGFLEKSHYGRFMGYDKPIDFHMPKQDTESSEDAKIANYEQTQKDIKQ